MNKKVIVLMSGGVDSSVSAWILKKKGYDVEGLFMQNWDSFINNERVPQPDNIRQCDPVSDFNVAKAVAKKLNIKITKINFIDQYWKKVFQPTIDLYKQGLTPNPDILCNSFIKFGECIQYINKKWHNPLIATGHYAITKGGHLFLSKDAEKDQTYFLCDVSNQQLKNILFPIGGLNKTQVRKIAKDNALDNFDKKDSTGVCFIGERDFKKFLSNYLPTKKGDIIDMTTRGKVGEHQGVWYYTLGQNKGLSLSGAKTRYFVCHKDVDNNILFVCPDNKKEVYLTSTSCLAVAFNFIKKFKKNDQVLLRFRHRGDLVKGKIMEIMGDTVALSYQPSLAVTPGQYVVVYKNKECLGGGRITLIK